MLNLGMLEGRDSSLVNKTVWIGIGKASQARHPDRKRETQVTRELDQTHRSEPLCAGACAT